MGFNGPYSGTRHQFMGYGNDRLSIPSNQEYSVAQLRMMLREVEAMVGRAISVEAWDALK